jgi:hypothetical protein
VDRVAEAVGRAQTEPSAALGFDSMESKPHVADQFPPAAARTLRGVGSWLKDSWDVRALERGPRGEGRIDFAGRRSVYRIGSEWRLTVEDRTFVGRPGAWTELRFGEVNYSPEWTLATVARTTDSVVVGSRRLAGEEYVELTGVATVDPALWVDNGGRYLRLEWLESPVMVRVWIDHDGRLRLARLRWEYGPGQREAEFEQVRRRYGSTSATSEEPRRGGLAGHNEVSIMLGEFGASWTLGAFDPDDAQRDREPVN